jgi:integrase
MAHINRLTALRVQRLKTPGMYPDGNGLYAQLAGGGSKSWVFRFSLRGRAREMGLGPIDRVPLGEARAKVAKYRKLLDDGVDPIERRKSERAKAALEQTGSITFSEAARQHFASHQKALRSISYAQDYKAQVAAYAEPVLGKLLVRDIDTTLVLKVLEPIWTTKTVTAERTRSRIERILDWARVRGYRSGENPARWKGHIDQLLPKPSKVRVVKRHAALPYRELSAFMVALRQQTGTAARALEFLILTAARSGELLKAEAGEIDHEQRLWTVPAEHMKGGQEHSVPLTDRALSLVDRQIQGRLFAIGKMGMRDLLQRVGFGNVTPHGFRSTFRDWAGDRTSFPREVAEAALAHKVGNAVEAAYRRGSALEQRRRLMQAWSDYCESAPVPVSAEVIAIRSA